MDIEEVASETPEKILTISVDPAGFPVIMVARLPLRLTLKATR